MQVTQDVENKWFVLRVLSGKERKIKDYLDIEISCQVACSNYCLFRYVIKKRL